MTALSLVNAALRLIGALAQGETAPATDINDAFNILNGMVDAWRAHRLTILAQTRQTLTLVGGTQTYTIGPTVGSSLVVTVRPIWIQRAAFVLGSGVDAVEYELEDWTEDRWAREPQKAMQGTQPAAFFYARTFPQGQISLWPTPSVSGTVALYWPEPLAQFANLTTTDYSLPPGYEEALKYNLAARLAPEFGKPLDAVVAALAMDALGTIKRANKELFDMSVDAALLPQTGAAYNILTDQ
jgi:hypothetical protein